MNSPFLHATKSLSAIAFTATLALCAAMSGALSGETILYEFTRSGAAGFRPEAALLRDANGNLFGTTSKDKGASGTVFELTSGGEMKVLHTFAGGAPNAFGPLIEDAAGNLYGTTTQAKGTVFELSPGGTLTQLYAFAGGRDGSSPLSGVIADAQGNLYGSTSNGGGSKACKGGCGTVFKVAPGGAETVLYRFQGKKDGAEPFGPLSLDSEGNIYGSTGGGGSDNCGPAGCGTVFKLAPGGTETVLYAFQGDNDGEYPTGGLIAYTQGNLYGTATFGGSGGCGTVFKLAPDGTETTIYAFSGSNNFADGCYPQAGLIADQQGNLYGTAGGLGNANPGTVFKIASDGTETVLLNFGSLGGGIWPYSSLILDAGGNLYGTTLLGGNHQACDGTARIDPRGCGTVFELSP